MTSLEHQIYVFTGKLCLLIVNLTFLENDHGLGSAFLMHFLTLSEARLLVLDRGKGYHVSCCVFIILKLEDHRHKFLKYCDFEIKGLIWDQDGIVR